MRVRGLKPRQHVHMVRWGLSHPVRVRGLKRTGFGNMRKQISSHPVRVRGLKHDAVIDFELQNWVAPRAGAWVETRPTLSLVYI